MFVYLFPLLSLVLGSPIARIRSSCRSEFKTRRQWANEKTNNHHTSGGKHGGYVMPVLFIADNRRRGLFKRKRIPRNLGILTSSFTYNVTVLIFEREKSPRVPPTVYKWSNNPVPPTCYPDITLSKRVWQFYVTTQTGTTQPTRSSA